MAVFHDRPQIRVPQDCRERDRITHGFAEPSRECVPELIHDKLRADFGGHGVVGVVQLREVYLASSPRKSIRSSGRQSECQDGDDAR